jgi:adenylate cyclase
MFSSKARRNISRITPFPVVCLLASLVYVFLERGLLGELDHYPSTGNPYHFISTLVVTVGSATLLGVVIGIIEVLYLNKLFVRQRFLKKLVYKTLVYLVIIVFVLLVITINYNALALDTDVFDPRVRHNVWLFITDYAFWSVELYLAAIIGISLFYTEVSDNLGQGVLVNFLTGKYHTPREEERIFMFVDLKSSTTIAEKIGHVQYFEMLKAYFADLSDPIIAHAGEIYQYVGDEVIVSWTVKNGLQENNCLRCFYAMHAAIAHKKDTYQQKFGVVPAFKAGVHIGTVTTGELGVLKKEIVFSGDVLNATARIQSLCNTYGADILVSGPLLRALKSPGEFQANPLGQTELRGRGEAIEIFSVTSGG